MDKMFIDIAIDTVQSAKKIAVDTFVKHELLSILEAAAPKRRRYSAISRCADCSTPDMHLHY